MQGVRFLTYGYLALAVIGVIAGNIFGSLVGWLMFWLGGGVLGLVMAYVWYLRLLKEYMRANPISKSDPCCPTYHVHHVLEVGSTNGKL